MWRGARGEMLHFANVYEADMLTGMGIEQTPLLKVDCRYCPIRHRAVCASCEPNELERLNAIKYYKSFEAGHEIASAGERTDFVASVVSGVAVLNGLLDDGRMQVVGLLLPSDFIGRPGRAAVAHDVTAVSDVTLCCFRREPFERLLLEMPHLSDRLLEMALDELDAAREWMLLLGRKTAREKVASFLMLVIHRSANPEAEGLGEPTNIILPLSREAIANFLGLTIETVSRQLTALKSEGIIQLSDARSVQITDVDKLSDIAGLSG